MQWQTFMQRWEGMQLLNQWQRLVIIGLLVCNSLLALHSFSREAIVTIQPPTLTESAWVGRHVASPSYHEAWGLFLASLLGNVTPGNIRFVEQVLGPLLAPEVYHSVMHALNQQTQRIQQDQITLRFTPKSVRFHADTQRVIVSGYTLTSGATGSAHREPRTYEFTFRLEQYQPVLTWLTTYQGTPGTVTQEAS